MRQDPSKAQRYRRKPDQTVTAVQLRLDTTGLRYRKWGHDQVAMPGDWLVDNGHDVYTVAGDVFLTTYRQVSPGVYFKVTFVYATRANKGGEVRTKEGISLFRAGDYLVTNAADDNDAYCIEAAEFERLYELDDLVDG